MDADHAQRVRRRRLDRALLFDDVEPDDITTLIAALAGALSERSREAAPPGLPTIRAYQRMVSDALLRWLRRRMS